MLTLSGSLTHHEASRLLRDGQAWLGAARQSGQAMRVDCAGLTQVDSSALAVLLSWQRMASALGLALEIANAPEVLRSLAALYGVSALLAMAPAASDYLPRH